VSLILTPDVDVSMSKASALSPTGRCRTWDAKADGFVRGEGAGLVVIKPLARALADGDRIYCVIAGTATNHSGRGNWIMEPSVSAQEDAIRVACQIARVNGNDIDYVEIHGTGTPKGDPIEALALGAVTSADRSPSEPCRVGSIKTNLGHLDAAAGVAGLIKTALCLYHRELVPSLHFEQCNPDIPTERLKLRVQTEHEPWPRRGHVRTAGVTAIGFGGTNVHAIVKGYDGAPQRELEQRHYLLPLSARSEEARRALALSYAERLEALEVDSTALGDLCYTTAARRTQHDVRLAVGGDSARALAAKLRAFLGGDSRDVLTGVRPRTRGGKLIFVFPGHGPQWLGMGRDLFDVPRFRETMQRCDELVQRELGWSVIAEIHAEPERSRLERADIVQPVLFSLAVSLAAVWRSYGIEPDAVVGHSFGEIAAACVASALSLEDAVRIVCARGRVTQSRAGRGGVGVVELPSRTVRLLLESYRGLDIGGENSPTSTLVTGPIDELEGFLAQMAAQQTFARRVNLAYASHGRDMDHVLGEFAQAIAGTTGSTSAVEFCSTVLGQVTPGTSLDSKYWARNLRAPVQFAAALAALAGANDTFLEISPHPVLLSAIEQNFAGAAARPTLLASLRKGLSGPESLDGSLARMYTAGLDVDWAKRYPSGNVVSTPTYPWQRDRLWVELADANAPEASPDAPHPLLGQHVEVANSRTHVWDGQVAGTTVLARDHRLQGVPVLPASAFIEMMIGGASRVLETEALELTDIELPRALFLLEGDTCRLQLVLTREPEGWKAQVLSRPESSKQPFRIHATAWVRRLEASSSAAPINPALIRERLGTTVSSPDCYTGLKKLGLEYGPAFQGIEWLSRKGDEVLARVRAPEGLDRTPYFFHPAFHDACLHPSVLAEPCLGHAGFVPVRIAKLEVYSRPTTIVYSHARVAPFGQRIRADIELAAPDGSILQKVEGLEFRHLDDVSASDVSNAEIASWLYQVEWTELALPTRVSSAPGQGTWLVLADEQGVGASLAAQVSRTGFDAIVVASGGAYREVDATRLEVNIRRPDDLAKALDWLRRNGASLAGIIHLWSLDLPPLDGLEGADVDAAVLSNCGSAVNLLQALERVWSGVAVPIWFVTRGAQGFGLAAEAMAPLQAPLWGLARAIAHEVPSRWGGLVDLDPGADVASSAARLWSSLDVARRGEDEILLRGGMAYAARLVRRPEERGPSQPLAIRRDASYLITGGSGGLGLATARFLAESGAKQLILAARTPLPAREEWDQLAADSPASAKVRAIREIESLGAHAHLAALDVTDADAVRAYLAEHARLGLPPIAGVFHLAGTVKFEDVHSLDAASLLEPMRSKIHATLILDRLLPEIDTFVLFSSASAVIRSPRLGHYAAGNAFLDAIAHYRRAQGRAALSVNWGLWSDVGYIERLGEARGPGGMRGMKAIAPRVGTRILGQLMRSTDIQTVVWPADWNEWARLYPAFTRAPLLAHLLHTQVSSLPPARAVVNADLRGTPVNEWGRILGDYLAKEIAARLNLSVEEVGQGLPLEALGFDSLQATDLQIRIRQDLEVEIPLMRFLGSATLQTIASVVLERVSTVPPPPISSPVTAEHVISADGTRLSCFRSGNGPRLVLVHGGFDDHTLWDSVLPELVDRFSVVAMDRRGCGTSESWRPSHSVDREIEDVVAVLGDHSEECVLVAHSIGALHALEAVARGARVRALVLYEPPILIEPPPPATLDDLDARWMAGEHEAVARTIGRWLGGLARSEPMPDRQGHWTLRVAEGAPFTAPIRALADYHFEPERAAAITAPTLLLLGQRTQGAIRASTEALAAAMPNARVVHLAEQAHDAVVTAPALFTEAVLDFLEPLLAPKSERS